ncbi:MAG: polysaccharide deacetylase family protein [Verrucomicrobia bacterium]|nr:polysaccharide deacetylase family protein [Verrucomicrobiota bacterium]
MASCLLVVSLLLPSCKTPEELAIDKRDQVYVAGEGQNNSNKKSNTTYQSVDRGWNPSVNVPRGSTGSGLSYSRVKISEPYVAMTFDDGPHPVNTPRLLDLLKARNIKATFYVVGTNATAYPHILRRMIAEGHEVGNHTKTHPYLTKLSAEGVRNEMGFTHRAIVQATGVAPKTMRPPYGATNSRLRNQIKQEFGYPSIMWAVDPQDWKRPGSQVVANRIVSATGNGAIILAHDIHAPTITAMPNALDRLLAKGFKFVTVTQLIALGEGSGAE